MLKQILSVTDVKKLKTGDILSDHPDFSLGKKYTIEKVSQGNIYAIHDNGFLEMKILKMDEVPGNEWWVFIQADFGALHM